MILSLSLSSSWILLPSSPVIVPKPPLSLPLPVHPPFAAMGHGCATLSVLVAALSELQRKSYTLVEQTLSGKVLRVSSMPCFQLAPQYILLGLAEALVTPACEHWRPALFNQVLGWRSTQLQKSLSHKTQTCIFLQSVLWVLNRSGDDVTSCLAGSLISFQLTPTHLRGISLHFLTLSYGGGCFLGAFIIQLLYLVSGGKIRSIYSTDYLPFLLFKVTLDLIL